MTLKHKVFSKGCSKGNSTWQNEVHKNELMPTKQRKNANNARCMAIGHIKPRLAVSIYPTCGAYHILTFVCKTQSMMNGVLSCQQRGLTKCFFLPLVVCFDGREQSKVSTRSTLWQVDECGEKLEASATNDRLLLSIHSLLWQARLLCFASDLGQKLTRSAHKWTGVGKVLSKLSCWLFLTR